MHSLHVSIVYTIMQGECQYRRETPLEVNLNPPRLTDEVRSAPTGVAILQG